MVLVLVAVVVVVVEVVTVVVLVVLVLVTTYCVNPLGHDALLSLPLPLPLPSWRTNAMHTDVVASRHGPDEPYLQCSAGHTKMVETSVAVDEVEVDVTAGGKPRSHFAKPAAHTAVVSS